MTIIVVFNACPEDISIYKFVNPTAEEIVILRRCHRQYINSVDCTDQEVIDFLNNLSQTNKVFDETAIDAPVVNIVSDSQVEIVVAGMML